MTDVEQREAARQFYYKWKGRGREDEDASRRVVFKFRLTDEEMIAQMQAILEENGETPTVSEAAPPVTPEAGAAEPEN